MSQKNSKSYAELSHLSSFEDRYNYLKVGNPVGEATFGFDRYLNQNFYRSKEWEQARNAVIVRDKGCDMGLKDYPIKGQYFIHHINPLTLDDVKNNSGKLLDIDNLVLVSKQTHNAIHFGDDTIVKEKKVIERSPFDTCPWRKNNGR